ncbi:hypothetical protein EC840_1263 [Rahnella sp. JUb53]|nr:hypothetical protein EC840_1263 [Rahnella sp. JUb53]
MIISTPYILRFINKTGSFYYIFSLVLFITGEADSTTAFLLLICSILGLVLIFTDKKKEV